MRILLVDADTVFARHLQDALGARAGVNYEFQVVTHLRAAFDVLSQPAAADVVLLGLNLADSQGLETARLILQSAENVPVVIIADEDTEAAAWRATEFGAQDVLLRHQLSPDMLIWALRHAVEQYLLRASLERHIRELELTNGRFLSLVVDNADAILVVDRVGIVRFVNPSAERLLRCSASDLLGQMFGIPLEGIETTEIDLPGRRSGSHTAEIRVMRTLWDGERAFIVSMRDISERKRTELALKLAKQTAEQANDMKSQFLASMSHELRTPLNAIIGYSEMMMMGIGGEVQPKRYQSYVSDIHAGGMHLLSLINDLLDLAKAESGKTELTEERFDLVQTAEAALEIAAGQAITAGVHLTISSEVDAIWLRADERLLKQAILNLVSNAIKFTPKGGTIGVSLSRTLTKDMRIVVKDTGIGMPKEQIPRAFAAFVQIGDAYTSKVGNTGTGLGLALTKHFVELHQGKISMESEEDVGTTVTIVLPHDRAVGAADQEGAVVPLSRAKLGGGKDSIVC